MTCQHLSGRDFLFSYGTYFFVAGVQDPILINVTLKLPTLLSAVFAFPTVQHVRRRRLLLPCIGGFPVCLFTFLSVDTARPETEVASKILITFMVIYNFLFTISLVVVALTYISETASTRLRF